MPCSVQLKIIQALMILSLTILSFLGLYSDIVMSHYPVFNLFVGLFFFYSLLLFVFDKIHFLSIGKIKRTFAFLPVCVNNGYFEKDTGKIQWEETSHIVWLTPVIKVKRRSGRSNNIYYIKRTQNMEEGY